MLDKNSPYVLVVGLGKTGYSCVHYFLKENKRVKVTDSRSNPPYHDQVRDLIGAENVSVGALDESLIFNASEVVLSPGISLKDPFVEKIKAQNKKITSDIQLFADAIKKPIIGITGANAKSTVCTLVANMINATGKKAILGGNIGAPVLDFLTASNDEFVEPDYYVLELSSFQLELVSELSLKVACILNISPDHMDRYVSMDEYIAAKKNIHHRAERIVVNREDENTFPNPLGKGKKSFQKNIVSFGLDFPTGKNFGLKTVDDQYFFVGAGETLLSSAQVKLRGTHNFANILAALAICSCLDMDLTKACEALKQFSGLEHRCEWVGESGGVEWINDSKGTNVGASRAAIQGVRNEVKGKIHLILGGVAKNADFRDLALLVDDRIGGIFIFGQDAEAINNCFKLNLDERGADKKRCVQVASLQEAVRLAQESARPGDLVLFSPACASFDMFDNFEHRGQIFKQIIHEQILKN